MHTKPRILLAGFMGAGISLLTALAVAVAAPRESRSPKVLAIERKVFTLEQGPLRSELFDARIGDRPLHLIRTPVPPGSEVRVRTAPLLPVPLADLAGPGPLVAINGGFFDRVGRPLGLIVQDGTPTAPLRRAGGSGILTHGPGGFRVVHRTKLPERGVEQAIQSIDRLVDAGASVVSARASRARDARSAVATFADGSAVLYTLFSPQAVAWSRCSELDCAFQLNRESTHTGVSLEELAAYLVSEGAEAALNLDGGFSTSFEARLGGRSLRVIAHAGTTIALIALAPQGASNDAP